ncbi:MAG: anthranilate phosphoribosyltransferase [Acidobacteriota bacterium]
MVFDTYLKQVVGGQPLTSDQAYQAANMLLTDNISEIKAAAFLTAMRVRRENEAELYGFVQALREHAVPMEADVELLDTCGTGGDGHGTFNVSTTAALVVAACGVPVAKHGNRAVTGKVGSADVLEYLGVRVDLTPDQSRRLLDEAGITFLFAPHYHPILKQVAGLRRGLGVATVFNFLGPLLNPFDLAYQVMGVADPGIQGTVATTLQRLGRKKALVLHAENGMDEISPAGITTVYEVTPGNILINTVDPLEMHIPAHSLASISGSDVEVNAGILLNVLDGQIGPCRDVVLLNSAAALIAGAKAHNMTEGMLLAAEAIDSGRALTVLKNMINFSRDGIDRVS